MPELKSVALPRLSDKIDAKFEKEVDKVNDTATGQKGSYEKCKLLKGWYPYGEGRIILRMNRGMIVIKLVDL